MWAQRLGHKNTSRVKPQTQTLNVSPLALFFIPVSSELTWLITCSRLRSPFFVMRRKRCKRVWNISEVSFNLPLFWRLFLSSFSLVTLERVCSHPSDSSWFKGSLKDTFWLFKLCLRKGGHVRLSYSPANWAHLPYDTVSLPPSLPPGNPFWPWKSPDPALRVC